MSILSRRFATALRAAPAAFLAAIAACGDAGPVSPEAVAAPEPRAALDIADSRTPSAPTGFYFAAPIGASLASYPGTFDGTRSPTVQICLWVSNACSGAPVATYTRTTGTGGATIAVDAATQLYRVDWPTVGLPNTNVYRIRVLDGALELGHADAKMLAPGETAAGLLAQGIVALGNTPRLAIRFRIEQNQAPAVAITAPSENAVVPAGIPVTLSAAATDAEEGNVAARLVWRSNQLVAPIGTGASVAAALPSGRNTISASVTDSRGATTTVSRQVVVSIISAPATLNVPFGGTASLPVSLSEPAPNGGLTLTVSTTDAARVGVTTSTIVIPAGAQSANATLSGVAPGAASVTVANADYGSATTQVATTASLNVAQSSIAFSAGRTEPITIELESQGADIAAPAGGLTVSLVSSNPSCAAVPATATIAAGLVSTTAPVTYAGPAATPCTASIAASVAGNAAIGGDAVGVTINPAPSISTSLTSATTVGAGLIRGAYSITLAAPAPAGGVVVTVSSTNPSTLELSPSTGAAGQGSINIPFAQGETSANYYLQGVEDRTGTATVAISAPGYTGTVSATVSVVRPIIEMAGIVNPTTALATDDEFTVSVGIPSGASLSEQNVRPGHSVTATVTNSNAAVAQLEKAGNVTGQSLPVTINAGSARTSSALSTGGIAFDPMGVGQTTVAVSADGFSPTAAASQTITVNGSTLTTNLTSAVSVGAGLIRGGGATVNLDGPAPTGGVTVTVASSNPAILELSPTNATVGQGTISLTIPAGSTSATFYLQGVEGQTGTATVAISAPGYNPLTSATVSVVAPAIALVGVDNPLTVTSADDDFVVYVGLPSGSTVSEQNIRPGHSLTVTIATSNAAVAQLKKAGNVTGASLPVTVSAGSSRSPSSVAAGGIANDPLSAGQTTLTATAAGFISTPNATQQLTVNGLTMSITLSSPTSVGSGLIRGTYNVTLSGPAPAPVSVTLASGDPSLLELSNTLTGIGAGSITVTIAQGATTSGNFYVQGVEGKTGSTTVTGTAAGYNTVTSAAVSVVKPAITLVGVDPTTTVLSNDDEFLVYVGLPSGATVSEQNVRPGHSLTVTIENSNSAVAQLEKTGATGQQLTVTIAGSSRSPNTVAAGGIALDPLGVGQTTVTATAAEATSQSGATQVVTVGIPAISMNVSNPSIGSGLIRGSFSVTLGAPAPAGGTVVTLSSSAPSVLELSPNATTVGQGTIALTIPAGTTSATFYLQGVEGQTGTATITASATGFTNATATATVVQPIIDISGLASSSSAAGADDPFTVRIGLPNATGTTLSSEQNVRPGHTMTATVTSSDPAAAQLKKTTGTGGSLTVTIAAGSSSTPTSLANGGIALDPLVAGSTTVRATVPGAIQGTTAVQTVTITP